MREDPAVTALLHSLQDDLSDLTFDPDSPGARANLQRILMAPPLAGARRRRSSTRGLALAVVPATLAVVAAAIAFVSSLSGSQPGLAQAAVIARAAAALNQPNTILYLKEQNYSAHGGVCMPGGDPFLMCIGFPSSHAGGAISTTPTFTFQEWVSPDGSEQHTIYGNGDETVTDSHAREYAAYDPADDTLTTLTDARSFIATTTTSPARPTAFPTISALQSPSYYAQLYQQAQAGKQDVQLVGRTTLDSESVYELRFDISPTPPSNAPRGDMCGTKVCAPPDMQILLYLDSHTFALVRSVVSTVNTTDRPGLPDGTSVTDVTDFLTQSLPDTPANQSLLQMSPHAGATQVQQTQAQYFAHARASLQSQVARQRPRSSRGGSEAPGATHRPAGRPQ